MNVAGGPSAAEAWGEHVRSLRERQGWTVAYVASETGVSAGTISKIENGRGTNTQLSKLLALQELFQLDSLEALFGQPVSASLAGVDVVRRRGGH